MKPKTLAESVGSFGAAAKAKLRSPSISGAPEDQLRAPLETLVHDLSALAGHAPGSVVLVGETTLSDLKTRPDYAVTLNNALAGFIEVKAPGKGADPRLFTGKHDLDQWDKLKRLPNLLYTDGLSYSLWRNGALVGGITTLVGDIYTSGNKLTATPSLLSIFADFLSWEPQAPRSAAQLAEVTALLCRLLREEVAEQLSRGSLPLTSLATDWRKLLFPSASDDAFADGYAQAVTFGLLMARAREIPLRDGLDRAARELRQTNTLIGTALQLLTDDAENEATLKTSLATLTRVLDAVHWDEIGKGDPEAWLYFYENFLSVYDNELRKKTGSYYTPPEVVSQMVRLVDDALKSPARFALSDGLASSGVTIADPATGTGTYLLGILRRIAKSIEEDQGAGAVAGGISAAIARLIGFELQFGPFAVAQLRLLAELRELMNLNASDAVVPPRLFVTDTLGNPYIEQEWIPHMLEPLAESRRQANQIKRQEKITVVIGNPPYKDKAKGLGGWVEQGSKNMRAPLDDWMPPAAWHVGAHAKHLRNLYIYFWRWATWKVFGDGDVDEASARHRDQRGIVCFITAAGFLSGDGFQKMRSDLRRDADEIWVIDCTPEGQQPPISSRIFQGVQQPICIVIALRSSTGTSAGVAHARYCSLPAGHRSEKFEALSKIDLDSDVWLECSSDSRSSFFPKATGAWADFPYLESFFSEASSGVLPGRTWVVAPDSESLVKRWNRLILERDAVKKDELFFPTLRDGVPADRHINKLVTDGLYGHETRPITVANDHQPVIAPIRFGFRSFDRQWLIPDNRLLLSARPKLWEAYSREQAYLVSMEKRSPENGPAITFSGLLPDMNFYKGSNGGRVFQLWSDRSATKSNIRAEYIDGLSEAYGRTVAATEIFAYLAGVAAHPYYTSRFQNDLVQPGLRIPVTADKELFEQAVELGKRVIWLHSFGEKFCSPSEGRPGAPPRIRENGPTIPRDGAISSNPDHMPDDLRYDARAKRLWVGEGYIDHVSEAVWNYEVSGKQVLVQWFSYRKLDRSRPMIGERRQPSELENIQPSGWLAEYTSELLNVLHVLTGLVELEGPQEQLLSKICKGSLLSAGKFAVQESAPEAQRPKTKRAKSRRKDVRQKDFLE